MPEKQPVKVEVVRRTRTHLLVQITDHDGVEGDYSLAPLQDRALPTFELVKETADDPEKHIYLVEFGHLQPSCMCPGWLRWKPTPCKHIDSVLQLYMRGELFLAAPAPVNPFTKQPEAKRPLVSFMTREQAIRALGTESKIELPISNCIGLATYIGDRTEKRVAILCQKDNDLWLLWCDERRALAYHDRGGFPAFKERLINIMWFRGRQPQEKQSTVPPEF